MRSLLGWKPLLLKESKWNKCSMCCHSYNVLYPGRDEVERERAKRAVNTANFGYLSAKHGGHFVFVKSLDRLLVQAK